MSCRNIAASSNRDEKNEILVETVMSTAVGIGATALTLVLASNPLGWGVALLLSAGSAAASWGAGYAAKEIYSRSGNRIDLVSSFNVDSLCS